MTGDESWFYHRKIPSKQDSKAWLSNGNFPPTEVRRQQYECLLSFFMTIEPLLNHQVPARKSLDVIYYRNERLKVFVENFHKNSPSSTTNGIKLHHDNACSHMKDIILNYLQAKNDQSDGPSSILTWSCSFRFLVVRYFKTQSWLIFGRHKFG